MKKILASPSNDVRIKINGYKPEKKEIPSVDSFLLMFVALYIILVFGLESYNRDIGWRQ